MDQPNYLLSNASKGTKEY